MKTICITGHSGSGKTTASHLMEKYLPNAFYIRKLDDMFYAIKNRDELEETYGIRIPADIDNERYYMLEIAKTYPNREEKFMELLGQLTDKNMDAAVLYAVEMYQPDYIIQEGLAMLYSKYWRDADYRIIVEPSCWERLIQFVALRREKQPIVDETLANERRIAFQETIDNAQNVSFRISNNYDDRFEQTIQSICEEITKQQEPHL